MKRCKSLSTVKRSTALLLLTAAMATTALSITATAAAQTSDPKPNVRQFPAAAMRGEMMVKTPPLLTLNGKAEQLSPGARIFDQNNMLVLSGQLVNREILVNYLRDGGGQIHQVWILNSEEAREKRAGSSKTLFNFITDLFGNSPSANPGASNAP